MTKQASLGTDAPLDVDRLVESRLLIQANSGAGKSWAIRRLLEQTYARVPQIVIDVEGEFHTLREKFDYVLAGQKGGDCPADTKSAAMLARRLLELNVSAIVDIYELGTQRTRFVRLFLEALVNAPRELWHPTIVVIDEAHMFAPEAGQAESADAVKDLMTRGRKRGFCGVLATQRISKLHKDAAAECNNKLIGRSSLDIDMKRAAQELGFTTREDMQGLRTLKPGTFYAFGPALSAEVRLITIGPVETTHPKAGERAAAPTPPRDKVKKILSQLADLPKEAEEEARTAAELRAKVKQLEAEVRAAKKVNPTPAAKVETKTIEKAVIKDAQIKRMESAIVAGAQIVVLLETASEQCAAKFGKHIEKAAAIGMKLEVGIQQLRDALAAATKQPQPSPQTGRSGIERKLVAPQVRSDTPRAKAPNGVARAAGSDSGAEVACTGALRRIMIVLAQHPEGLTDRKIGVYSGVSTKGGSFRTYISRARGAGWIEDVDFARRITDAGLAAVGHYEPLPTGPDLADFWMRELGGAAAKILQVVIDAYPHSIDDAAIGDQAGVSIQGGSYRTYLSRLRSRDLIKDVGRGARKASAELFTEAS